MAVLYPFRALRFSPAAGEPGELISPPFDRLGLEETETLRNTGPFHAVWLECPEQGASGAARTLSEWLGTGILKRDSAPAIYIYEQKFVFRGQKRTVKGLLCRVKTDGEALAAFSEAEPEQSVERLELIKATSCEFSPVRMLYEDDGRKTMSRVNLLSRGKPRISFTRQGVTHRLWVINDQLILRTIREDFEGRKLRIADSFEGFQAARQVGAGSVFALLTDLEQETALIPFHCTVSAGGFDIVRFLADCRPYFQVISREAVSLRIADEIESNLDALYRQGKKAFGLYTGGKSWTLLLLLDTESTEDAELPQSRDTLEQLDGSLLRGLILERLLGINPALLREQCTFLLSAEEAVRSVERGEARCAFLLNPPRLKEICEVADSGEPAPPKTACCYPPVPAGLVMSMIEDV